MAYQLIRSEDLKTFTKGEFNEAFDPLLDTFINPAVTRSFARYCNRDDFDLKTRTEFFTPYAGDTAFTISSPPVLTPPNPHLWLEGVELIYDQDFFVFPEAGIFRLGTCRSY